MTIKNVTVLGTGVLGAQIAFQTAYMGFAVTAYDINDDAVAKADSCRSGRQREQEQDRRDAGEQNQHQPIARCLVHSPPAASCRMRAAASVKGALHIQ